MRRSLVPGAVLVTALLSGCSKQQPAPVPVAESKRPPRQARRAQPAAKTEFTRLVTLGKTEGKFETAITSYADDTGHAVDLVGVVHIADAGYYAKLNEELTHYDAVLYELVAKHGTRPSRQRVNDSLLSRFQIGLKRFLELEFQLDAIDYGRDNFVHADLTPKRMAQLMNEKGESVAKLVLRAMLVGIQRQHEGNGPHYSFAHVLLAFLSPDRARYLKFLLAHDLGDVERTVATFGADNASGTVLVGERNKAAIAVLREQMKAGKHRLAIFYGAAHLPDMENRLRRLGFRKRGQRWLTAWDMVSKKTQVPK